MHSALKIREAHKTVVRECTARAGSRALLTSRHCRAYTSTDVPMCTLCTQQAWAVQSEVFTGQALLLRKVHGTYFAFCHRHMVCSQSRMYTHSILMCTEQGCGCSLWLYKVQPLLSKSLFHNEFGNLATCTRFTRTSVRPSARLSIGDSGMFTSEVLLPQRLLTRNAFCFTRTAFKLTSLIHTFGVVGCYPFRVLYHALSQFPLKNWSLL